MTARQKAAKEYLKKYEEACRKVRQCLEQYERAALLVDAIRSASDNDGMPHGSGISKPTENKAIRLSDKAMDIINARTEAYRIEGEVFAVIYRVGGVEGDVLIERYIKLKDWGEVYKAVSYSERQTHRYHQQGLDKVADILHL